MFISNRESNQNSIMYAQNLRDNANIFLIDATWDVAFLKSTIITSTTDYLFALPITYTNTALLLSRSPKSSLEPTIALKVAQTDSLCAQLWCGITFVAFFQLSTNRILSRGAQIGHWVKASWWLNFVLPFLSFFKRLSSSKRVKCARWHLCLNFVMIISFKSN